MSTPAATIRLLIVDDHFVARNGLRRVAALEADFQVVAEAARGTDAVALYAAHRPDVVVVDLRMDDFDGIATISAIRQLDPQARVVVFSSYQTDTDIVRARKAGALGFVSKEAPLSELVQAVRLAARGEPYVPPHVAHQVAWAEENPLGVRELQILEQLSRGLSEEQAASALGLSANTVNKYVRKLFVKLRVNNRAAAVFNARERGLLGGRRRD